MADPGKKRKMFGSGTTYVEASWVSGTRKPSFGKSSNPSGKEKLRKVGKRYKSSNTESETNMKKKKKDGGTKMGNALRSVKKLFQGNKWRKIQREARRKRRRTQNPYD